MDVIGNRLACRIRRKVVPEICAHSFRGTEITEYLRNGRNHEVAARIAGHESTCTTQLYDRLHEEISLDEIERIQFRALWRSWCSARAGLWPRIARLRTRARPAWSGNDTFGWMRSSLTPSIKMGEGSARAVRARDPAGANACGPQRTRHNGPMTKSDSVHRITRKQPQLGGRDVETAVKMMLDHMVECLAGGGCIEIRGFGSFMVRFRRARVGRNPRTGTPVSLPARYAACFKPGMKLRERVDSESRGPTESQQHADGSEDLPVRTGQ